MSFLPNNSKEDMKEIFFLKTSSRNKNDHLKENEVKKAIIEDSELIQNPHSLFMVSMVLTLFGCPLLPSAQRPCTVVLSLGKEPTNLTYIVYL